MNYARNAVDDRTKATRAALLAIETVIASYETVNEKEIYDKDLLKYQSIVEYQEMHVTLDEQFIAEIERITNLLDGAAVGTKDFEELKKTIGGADESLPALTEYVKRLDVFFPKISIIRSPLFSHTSQDLRRRAAIHDLFKDRYAEPENPSFDGLTANEILQTYVGPTLRVLPAPGDGTCQFYALEYALDGTTRNDQRLAGSKVGGMLLRRDLVAHIRDNQAAFFGFIDEDFDEYTNAMVCDKFGDNTTLQAAANLYGKEIVVLYLEAGTRKLKIHELTPVTSAPNELWAADGRVPLYLFKTTFNHYDAVALENDEAEFFFDARNEAWLEPAMTAALKLEKWSIAADLSELFDAQLARKRTL